MRPAWTLLRFWLLLAGWSLGPARGLAVDSFPDADARRGEQLFQQQCAACHGNQGQGVPDQYPDPLSGDYPREHLLDIIERTMPEDDPAACVGQAAADVTAYVYDNFYGPNRRDRRRAPSELMRLTVPQFRNTIADLLLSLRSAPNSEIEGNGLRGAYFASRRLDNESEVRQQIDPSIDFDFGEGTPEPACEFPSDEFGIRWEGGLMVERTGLYRIHLRSENGTTLWLNDRSTPLIDASVRSGAQTHEQAEIFLLGGRVYPLKIEFFKRNDSRASISLSWETVDGLEEPIPGHHLVQGDFPEVFVVTASFPPDDRSLGYQRGSSASRVWAEAVAAAAIETANAILDELDEYAAMEEQDDQAARREKQRQFCARFAELAFRRPLSTEQISEIDACFEHEEDDQQSVKRVLLMTLTSPRFLYPTMSFAPAHGDEYAIASRLSYALWDCPPDASLLDAARRGQLGTRQQVAEQAKRMMLDQRTHAKLYNFFRYWLDLDADHDLTKDLECFPGFDDRLIVDLERSLERFVEQVVWSDASDFRRLLTEPRLLLNSRLADFYGTDVSGEGFVATELDELPRAGVLTHPYMLAALAHRQSTSPIHRGVFILRRVLGRTLRNPPEAIDLLDESLHPDLTTRQRIELQTQPDSCQTCHALINPFGFALEHYDAVGRFRSSEGAQVVDASGAYTTTAGERLQFNHARELAESLATQPETYRAFVEEVFVYMAKQPLAAQGDEASADLCSQFEQDFHIRNLVWRAATLAAWGPAEQGQPEQ